MRDSDCHASAVAAVSGYRTVMQRLLAMTALERYLFQVETDKRQEMTAPDRAKS